MARNCHRGTAAPLPAPALILSERARREQIYAAGSRGAGSALVHIHDAAIGIVAVGEGADGSRSLGIGDAGDLIRRVTMRRNLGPVRERCMRWPAASYWIANRLRPWGDSGEAIIGVVAGFRRLWSSGRAPGQHNDTCNARFDPRCRRSY